MWYRVEYLPLGVKNVKSSIFYFCLTDIRDYGMVPLAAKTLGVLVSDIKKVEVTDGCD